MRDGRHEDGSMVLRAKIDMASPNINMRDPAIYRIRRATHHNTGDKWCIYPMYTFAHPIEDALENITHSICTLEFEDQRPFYDWLLDRLAEGGLVNSPHPRQYEFARLNLTYVVTSKRKLKQLVDEKHVGGWDDPRLPTIAGLRRRGYTPESLRAFVARLGLSKQNATIDFSELENALREDLDARASRRMAVLDPIKLVLTNLPIDHVETLHFANHPKDAAQGTREVPFARELWIEREDFMEVPSKGFHRLIPGGEVRLRGVGIIRCNEVIKDGERVRELHGTLDPDTRAGLPGADRKIKGTIHWVSARHAVAARVRLYDRLFTVPDPDDDSDGKTYRDHLNPESRREVQGYLEPAAAAAVPEQRYQFERLGYFVADRREHQTQQPVFNRAVTLRDTWAKQNG
jgi:glutaminyl-tRNA synthetase